MLLRKITKKIQRTLFKKNQELRQSTSVGLLYLCTGKYEMFFDQFFNSFNKHFLPGAKKKYFVFTDSKRLPQKYAHIVNIYFFEIEHLGWPLGTLLRNECFNKHFDSFQGVDYLFFCNANLVCNKNIFLDDLGLVSGVDLCGVQHPGYFQKSRKEFPLEQKIKCNAYFSLEEISKSNNYFQGCFYGGKKEPFYELVKTIYEWTCEDLGHDIMPVWLDESYLNRYFFLNPPFALHAGFAYPEKSVIPLPKMIVQLDKSGRDKTFARI